VGHNQQPEPVPSTASLGQPKAAEAARICSDAKVTWEPRKARFEGLGITPGILVPAVYTNPARGGDAGRAAR